jgi:hypothetical protein
MGETPNCPEGTPGGAALQDGSSIGWQQAAPRERLSAMFCPSRLFCMGYNGP